MCSDMHVVRLVCLNLSHCAVESSRILCGGISASDVISLKRQMLPLILPYLSFEVHS